MAHSLRDYQLAVLHYQIRLEYWREKHSGTKQTANDVPDRWRHTDNYGISLNPR